MNIAQLGYPVGDGGTAISNELIRQKNLSLKARGMMAYILSKPDLLTKTKGDVIDHFVQCSPAGKESCKNGLNELIAAGLIPEWSKLPSPTLAQRGKPGFVYVLEESRTGLYKIGSSKNPKKRAQAINNQRRDKVTLLVAIQCGDMGELENLAHEQFSQYRQDGEWFLLPKSEVVGIEKTILNLGAAKANLK